MAHCARVGLHRQTHVVVFWDSAEKPSCGLSVDQRVPVSFFGRHSAGNPAYFLCSGKLPWSGVPKHFNQLKGGGAKDR